MDTINHYRLTEEIERKFIPIIQEYINKVEETKEEISELILTGLGINPFQTGEILEKLGYNKDYQDDNGWEMDFWLHYKKPNHKNLLIFGTGITFELAISEDYDY